MHRGCGGVHVGTLPSIAVHGVGRSRQHGAAPASIRIGVQLSPCRTTGQRKPRSAMRAEAPCTAAQRLRPWCRGLCPPALQGGRARGGERVGRRQRSAISCALLQVH
eukprot:scaffold67770_cov82-Phaeocystis_antarctica.AAC.3